jgi:hypothetical protein
MAYSVEVTDTYYKWWDDLSESEQIDIEAVVGALREKGPLLGFPYSSGIEQSNYSHMRELRIQHKGRPYRVLYAFDPRRAAILLIGGDKTGNNRWYDKFVPVADKLYAGHISQLKDKKKGSKK